MGYDVCVYNSYGHRTISESAFCRRSDTKPQADRMGGSRGGDRGPDPPPGNNCQIIDFCHVEIFRKTPLSG